MRDESIPPADGLHSEMPWTEGQLGRLENEFRRAQRSFAYHPVISIRPLRGEPPYEYQIDYRVRSLATNDAGELEYVDEVSMHLWLPAGFPNQPPVVRPMAPVFHPNVAWEGVYLERPWQPTDTLVTLAARVGELLAFRGWDVQNVANAVAMEWVSQNVELLPLDAQADFSQFNGGEPLGRIQRLGPATLEQVRRALDDMRFALVAEEGAPAAEEIAAFARETRSVLSLFLDSDIPDNLRKEAIELDTWCRELPESVPMWEYLRQQRTRAASAEQAAMGMTSAGKTVAQALDEVERWVSLEASAVPAELLKAIPPMEKMAPMQLRLPATARELEKCTLDARKLVVAMKAQPPPVVIASAGALGRLIAAQSETVKDAVANATRLAESALAETEATYRRSRPQTQAFEQAVNWRAYMEMFARARDLEKQIAGLGSAGVQSFFLDNSAGTFGPFQFEEPIDLGSARVVVRSAQRGHIEVINPAGQDIIGASADGKVAVLLPQEKGQPAYDATFRLAERCDNLIVQIEFIQQETLEMLARFQRPVSGATGWCGMLCALIADPRQQQNLHDAHRKTATRWKALIVDLVGLSRFKERLATHHLLSRMGEEVPRVKGLINAAQARHQDATQKISAIMSKGTRDLASDQLIIPPKLVKSYTEELESRESAKQQVGQLRMLLKQIARELVARLSSARLVGRPELPAFAIIPPLTDELAALSGAMTDEKTKEMVDALGRLLGVTAPLPCNAPPAPVKKEVVTASKPAVAPARPPHIPRPAPRVVLPSPVAPRVEAPAIVDTSEAETAGAFLSDEAEMPAEYVEEPASQEASGYGYEEEPQSEDVMIEGFFTEEPPGAQK